MNISSDKITDKIFFFSIYKGIKIFLKKKTKNDKKHAQDRYQNFLKKKKKKSVSTIVNIIKMLLKKKKKVKYMRIYYLVHKKYLLS